MHHRKNRRSASLLQLPCCTKGKAEHQGRKRWPLEIDTLGRFEVRIKGWSIRKKRKAPHRRVRCCLLPGFRPTTAMPRSGTDLHTSPHMKGGSSAIKGSTYLIVLNQEEFP